MTLPELPELIGGKYRPLGIIGEGAMGIVYSVEHILTGEQLALKVMTAHQGASRDAIERFKREARASAKIKSEHVVRIIDADVAPELDRAPYLVMDLLEGTDLEKAADDQPVPPAVVMEWLRQIARALEKAHRIGIVHRDLKPENLFLTYREDGRPLIKILDFGIAKIAAESTGTTQSGQILGTPLYMSPEQARGDPARIGPSSDLYALGLIAYKLLIGTPYWDATSVAAIIGQVLYEPMAPPSTRGSPLGPEFDQWFLRACNRDSSLRFTSPLEQVEMLARAIGQPTADNALDALRSNPGASADTFIGPGTQLSPGGRYGTETIAQSGHTLVSSSTSTGGRIANPSRRKAVFYTMIPAAFLLVIGVVMFSKKEPAPAPTVLAAQVPAPAVITSTLPPAPTPPAASTDVLPTEIAGASAKPGVMAVAAPLPAPGKRKEPPAAARPTPARAAPTPGPAHIERTGNDPLGDQK
ncbi:MAG TPA: serine/threonine-protein kinase [Polyangiaceae bacterium]|nr:serine/threonine-protein kinase [Polyangiaceae bacterium]